jgi:hypothetical protein
LDGDLDEVDAFFDRAQVLKEFGVWQNGGRSSAPMRSSSGIARLNASGDREIARPRSPRRSLIGLISAVRWHSRMAHAMRRLNVLLLDGFNRHETHGGPARGLDEIDAENVDFYDESPHVRFTSIGVSRRKASGLSQ